MQYLVSVIAVTADSPALATPQEEAAIDVYLDVALRLAAEGSKACNRKIEVRPFL